MDKIIAVFNEDLLTKAFVNSDLSIEFLDGQENPDLIDTIKEIGDNPNLQVENFSGKDIQIGLEKIDKEDPRFLDALAMGLNSRLFTATVVPVELKDMLKNLNMEDLSYEKREEVIATLTNMTEKEASYFIKDAESLRIIIENAKS